MNRFKISSDSVKFPGLLVVISAPSGGGKTTVIREILKTGNDRFQYSISATTRPRREKERDGVDYFFFDEDEFQKKIELGDFLEWAIVHGNKYGTPRSAIENWLRQGKIVLLDLDVQGGIEIKKRYGESALLIFIMPPSITALEDRLRRRRTDSDDIIDRRLAAVPLEIAQAKFYDVVIVNTYLKNTIAEVITVIDKTHNKIAV